MNNEKGSVSSDDESLFQEKIFNDLSKREEEKKQESYNLPVQRKEERQDSKERMVTEMSHEYVSPRKPSSPRVNFNMNSARSLKRAKESEEIKKEVVRDEREEKKEDGVYVERVF